jgi:LPS export ABC transporter protein LptC
MRARAVLVSALVALIAAGACNRDAAVVAVGQSPLADSADQVLSGIEFLLTSGGVLQGKLEADSGFMFENSTRIELRHVKTEFFTKTGDSTGTLTSREGTYLKSQGSLEARDSVVVLSTDGRRRLTTPQLKYDERTNLITTDSAYVLTQDGQVHRGVGFSTDPDITRFECKSSCSGAVIISRPPS